jgi:Protein of unknown function (DUF3363)
MQRALKQAGIERPVPGLAVFESGRRRTRLAGKVVAVGLVDEITDRQYVIVDGIDGRVHYAPLGRLPPAQIPGPGMIVSLSGDSLHGKPNAMPRLQVLSLVGIADQIDYDGPTWLDGVLFTPERLYVAPSGFGGELNKALADRSRWLVQHELADTRADGGVSPRPNAPGRLRQGEANRLVRTISDQLKAVYVPHEMGERVSGVYDGSITTPTGRLAIIRNQDTFTLSPWRPALEPMRGRAVTGLIQPHRVTWMADPGRAIPIGRGR